MTVQILVVGVFVAMVVQFAGERLGLDCSVTPKYGVVLRTIVTELVFVDPATGCQAFVFKRLTELDCSV